MYEITEHAMISGDLASVWSVVTDVKAWPAWDPHEQDARLDGPFETGTRGWSKPHGGPATDWTLTKVEDLHQWESECGLPGGKIVGGSAFENAGEGRVRCTKTMRITGPLVPLFRLYFGPRIRRDMHKTWAALEVEVARRAVPQA